LQQVAQIIQVASYLGMNRQIFFCSLGGFDTHGGELETHNTLYPQVSQAISAFYAATQELGVAQNVTTFTESDFSRTFQPTTTDGSDHAWGSHHMVIGGAVQGGQIYGAFPTFELGGPERHRHARALDSDHVGRSVRRDAGLVVRNSRRRAGHGVSELRQLRVAESGEKDRVLISGRQLLSYANIVPTQQFNCDVTVEEIRCHSSIRFSTAGCTARSSSGRLPIRSVNNSVGQPCRTASSTTWAGSAASSRPVCERLWIIRATSSTCSGRSLLSSVMTSSIDAILLPYAM
jgi:hypothetical protein